MPIELPSSQIVQNLFYTGHWLLYNTSDVEVFVFVFVKVQRLTEKGILGSQQIIDLLVVDLNVGTA